MIELRPFDNNDYSQLIAEIPDARFLLQWAGPRYAYPLNAAQLNETMARTGGEKPAYQVFKAVKRGTADTVGHIQLMNIDYNSRSCFLGRVLIFREYRGKGFGKEMVDGAVRIAFVGLDLNEIVLGVFDFNFSAIALYRKIGFSEFQHTKETRQFGEESWNLIRMKLYREDWAQKNPSDAPASIGEPHRAAKPD